MGNDMMTFNFEGEQITALDTESKEPVFVASPIAKKLGHRDAADMLRGLDPDEKGTHNVRTLGGTQEMSVITLAGLNHALNNRRAGAIKDEATRNMVIRFQRWVNHDVLPSIYKHGAYMTEQTIEKTLTDPDFIIRLATQLKTERAEKEKALAQVEQLEPKAQALDDFTESGPAMTIRDAAGVLRNMGLGNLRETDLRNWLLDHDWIYRKNGAYKIRSNRLDAKHLQYYYPAHQGQHRDGSTFDFNPTVYVTRRGLALLHQRISEERMPFRFNQPVSQPQLPPTVNYNITV